MASGRIFGEVEGFPAGTEFPHRMALHTSGVHRPPQGGICGTAKDGAESIVMSGGYPEDDFGDRITYTGEGGWDSRHRLQVLPQELTRGNAALVTSFDRKSPVRVIRGAAAKTPYSPQEGYRYDGLFRVTGWREGSRNGHRIFKFDLEKL